MKEIHIYANKNFLLASAVGSLLFASLSLFFLVYGIKLSGRGAFDQIMEFLAPPVFYIALPLSIILFIYILYRLVKPTPYIIINQEGIFAWRKLVLRWEEIKTTFIYESQGNRLLGIIPVNTEAFIARQSFIKRLMYKIFGGMEKAPFSIPERLLPMSLDELLLKFKTFQE